MPPQAGGDRLVAQIGRADWSRSLFVRGLFVMGETVYLRHRYPSV